MCFRSKSRQQTSRMDQASTREPADLTVLNQAPQVIAVVSDARDLATSVLPGTPVSIEASFSDLGPD